MHTRSLVASSERILFRFFTDAAIDHHNRIHSFGIVVLDELDRVKTVISKPCIGSVSAVIAKAKAIFHAVQWIQLLHLLVDVLKTECKTIVDKLNSCNWNGSPRDDVLLYRDSNELAHKIAKLKLRLNNELV
uniref:RNase H type-1 domain-containing protein n=1 Tax=Cannabis sativa TaxID=3483 RepID=A0A803QGD4_CANSA